MMQQELILDNIAKHIDLTLEEQKHFLSLLSEKKVRRKQFLLHEGEISKYNIFVTEGCLRGYTIDKNGYDHILSFACRDWWIADMYSLLSQQPGTLNIDAILHSQVLLLSKQDQEQLYHDIPKFERFFRIIVENSLVASQQRLIDNLSLPAEERLKKFYHRFPELRDTLPQKLIASYIGITPEFLSKLRNERRGL